MTNEQREQIERQARIGGGISRNQTQILLNHIDTLQLFLEEVITNGEDWEEEEWSLFTANAMLTLDGKPIRTSKKLFPLR